jgi:hypothetical protein
MKNKMSIPAKSRSTRLKAIDSITSLELTMGLCYPDFIPLRVVIYKEEPL